MKKVIPFLFCFLLLCGCSKTQSLPAPQDLANTLLENCSFSEELQPVEGDVAVALYGLQTADVSESYVYLSAGATAEELVVISSPDEAAAERVETALQQRVTAQKEAYASYGPAEIPKLDSAVIRRSGTTTFMVVAQEDPSAAVANLFK